ncbi:ABC transporter permease [Micromonospora sp. RTP1Z1]|uniref:ABC transporter permease n=1 Tax=Micromonospora sp. RTP1Z1 TaxID=2994043 RepID=UPI0029C8EF3C|nr:ABC transporter permease [Micromonospora sp. RTP1Z1]
MKLVWRRAVEARGLLLAAAVAALVAVALVAGLSDYNRRAVAAGQRTMLQAAPAEERSLLVSGSGGADAAAYADRDRAVRAQFADGLGGVPASVAAARHGTGRELTGDLGAARVGDDPLFADLATLDDLAGHAELTTGGWPTPGANPLQVTLPEKVAGQLGLRTGDRVPLFDRSAERAGEVVLAGTWRPFDPAEAYWRLAPGVGDGGAGAVTSYGPFALDPADFARTFPGSSSASWLVAPDLAGVEPSRLTSVTQAVATISAKVPEATGLGSSAQSVSTMDRLTDRLGRADLVGRSALLTPLLLIVVLGGYALVLVAALLNEDRRAQTALLRARGAARGQLAGLAVREATLVVAPAVLLAPALAGATLRRLGAGTADLRLADGGAGPVWAVAVAAAVGCLLAMVLPALRRAGTYVADMAARSRPTRGAAVQRASVDLALVALAVLAWTQLRQYSWPLAGAGGRLGIDPLLAAAPTLGGLAGAVVARRLLPPATRVAERCVDRRPWTASLFGMWQAGRRPHAGPVLLLALAVGGSTLAWSLVASWEGSQRDQAQHRVGADLRLDERSGVAPAGRAAGLAAVPGVDRVLPAWRDDVRVGRDELPATVVSLDAAGAAGTLRLDDAAGGASAADLLDRLARGRAAPAGTALPATARQLTGAVRTPAQAYGNPRVEVTALLTTDGGPAWRLPLATARGDGRLVPFTVRLPDTGGATLRLAGFEADGGEATGDSYRLRIDGLGLVDTAGARLPLALTGGWNLADARQGPIRPARVGGSSVDATYQPVIPDGGRFADLPPSRFVVVPDGDNVPAPALLTSRVRAALNVRTGDTVTLSLAGVTLPVRVVGEVEAVPATADSGGGVLVDLPAATDWLLRHQGTVRPVPEWWLRIDPAGHAGAATALAGLPGVTVLDRRAVAAEAARDPYWLGARTGLLAAALGSVVLALVGLAVDVWATARRRLGEFAVLHTLGAAPRLLARALLAEQAFLAGIGVGVGLLVGAGVAATMVPLVILTPAAGRPVPDAAFLLPWTPIGLTALGLLVAALAFSAVITTGIRQRVAALQLRIGGDQ